MTASRPTWAARICSFLRSLLTIAFVIAATMALTYLGALLLPHQGATDMACERITGRELAALFAPPEPDPLLRNRLQAQFGVEIEAETLPALRSGANEWPRTVYRWNYADAKYRLTRLDNRPQRAAVVYPWGDAPAVSRVLECLGSPDAYTARLVTRPKGEPMLNVALVYNDLGMIAYLEATNGGWMPPKLDAGNAMQALSPASPVRAIRWVQPGALEAMDWRIQPNQGMPDAAAQAAFNGERAAYYRTFRPWPGSIEALQLTDASGSAPSGCCASDLPAPGWTRLTAGLAALALVVAIVVMVAYTRYAKAGFPKSWRWEIALIGGPFAQGALFGLALALLNYRGLAALQFGMIMGLIQVMLMRIVFIQRLRSEYAARGPKVAKPFDDLPSSMVS